ncbi:MAG: lytic transglycosylase domain-containing protein, partial [Muribaculaceae bacterium]|nr:lytic transglycosylase domain-containing protein [Muribaculaceae bacterium]
PGIAPILKANGVPDDVIYLACAESSLNPRAYSPAKAAGFWQFLASTAKQYGLEVNDEIDERYNLEKATAAACRYLKKALQKYGDWPTVMASYNAGMGRISGELEKQISDNSFDLYLNDETSRYVFRIMAIKTILENPSAYGYKLTPNQLYRNTDCKIVEVSGPVEDWATWAQKHGISYAQLKEENPWIRSRSLTNKAGKTYQVKVPKNESLYRSKQPKTVYNSAWVN